MSKSFSSTDKLVSNLLGNFERRIIAVPRFQRGYSWEKTHVNEFWTDLVGFEREYAKSPTSATYFLGPIVIEDKTKEIVLLDGQQRLATVTILLSIIRDASRTIGTWEADKFADDIQEKLILKEDGDDEVALHLGELDIEYFRKTIQDDPPNPSKQRIRSHVRIAEAAKLLKNEVSSAVAGLSAQKSLKQLKSFRDCLVKGMTLVAINVEDENDAFSIFETLNDRGLRLSVPDLLLNLLMSRSNSKTMQNRVRIQWNSMLERMGKKDISRFLRHMWLARYGDLKARGLFAELKGHLATGAIPSTVFVEDCSVDCDSYIALVDQTADLPVDSVNSVAGLIKYMGVTSSLPLLLSGLQCLKPNDFVKLADFVASLALRYSIIANLNPSTLESAFYEAAREIRGKKAVGESSPKMLSAAKVILEKLNPDDPQVRKLAVSVDFDRGTALWLLTQLANAKQSSTKEISISRSNLEHIFPLNSKTAAWPNQRELLPYKWRLGNLTILGEKLNSDAANKAYSVKSANYYKNSEIKMTKEILAYATWNATNLTARGKALAGEIVAIFQ